jgi:PAS domain S-box-containing protein
MTARGRELRGFGPEERLDIARFFASIHSEDRDAVRRAIDGAIQGNGSFELEYRVLGPDGKPRWVALRGASENDASGGVVLRGVSIDITRRKQAETEARTRELEMAHLARATLLGELSGSLAHELNQPLTAILSNAQAAQRLMEENRETREEIREIFAEIIAEDKRAGDVIRKLRGLLKKGEVHVEALDVAELGDEVLRLMHSDFVSHGVNIETDFPAGLPRIAADRVQIVQVLVNLAANACDAMDDRPPEARRLLLGARVDGDGVVCTSVTDNGPGIASDDFARLFQPFVTTKKQGMGLGLAICRTIVTAHGGRIWATNSADGGASFHFTLPTAEPAP